VALDEYRWPGQIAALLLTIAGTLLVLIAGGLAVARLAGTGCNVRGIILGACALELLAIVLGPVMWTRGRDLFQSTFLSVSAVGHSGLHVGGLPGTLDWRTHVVLLPLSILGGLGVAVLLTLAQRLRRRERLDGFVRLALALWAAGYVIGVIALALLNSDNGWTSAAADASVQSINSRSIGFGYPVGDSRVKQWILMLLMATGGISGAAAGGIKLTTLACVFTGLRRVLRGDAPGRVFAVALAWIGAYGLLVFAGTVGLLATEPGQPADRLLFLVVSAASNVGLSQNPVSTTGSGLFVLSAVMLLGRVLPLAALWWAVAVARDENEIPVG